MAQVLEMHSLMLVFHAGLAVKFHAYHALACVKCCNRYLLCSLDVCWAFPRITVLVNCYILPTYLAKPKTPLHSLPSSVIRLTRSISCMLE